jgi:transcriptional regulator with XRE-family HTH domain
MNDDFPAIGETLRKARLDRGLTQQELGQQLARRQGTVSSAERGRDLRLGTLIQLAHALDLEVLLVPRRQVAAILTLDNHRHRRARVKPSVPTSGLSE